MPWLNQGMRTALEYLGKLVSGIYWMVWPVMVQQGKLEATVK